MVGGWVIEGEVMAPSLAQGSTLWGAQVTQPLCRGGGGALLTISHELFAAQIVPIRNVIIASQKEWHVHSSGAKRSWLAN